MLFVLPGAECTLVEVGNHPVEQTDEDEAVEEDCDGLTTEDSSRRELGVMSELLIGDVVVGLRLEVGTVGLHDHLSLGVAGEPDSG